MLDPLGQRLLRQPGGGLEAVGAQSGVDLFQPLLAACGARRGGQVFHRRSSLRAAAVSQPLEELGFKSVITNKADRRLNARMTFMAGPTFFPTEAEFRRWLEINHTTAPELLVGFWKKGSGKPSIDWPQARDQALCFGWIDGVRKSLGDDAYTIRFTPRRKGSIWSKVNLERFEALKAAGQMTAGGRAGI